MNATASWRRWVVPALFVFATSMATAQTASQGTASDNEQQVKNAQQQLLQASIKGDKDDVARYLTDDVTWVGSDGRMMNRQQRLEQGPAPVRAVDTDTVRVAGRTAIVTGTAHLNNGTDTRFLQEWVNQGGQWKLQAHQGTPVVAAPASGATGTTGMAPATGMSGKSVEAGMEPRTVAPTLSTADERAVWKAQTDLVTLYAKGDVNGYSRLTSDEFRRIETTGQTFTKANWLDRVRSNTAHPTKAGAISDVHIRVDGNVATATMKLVPFNADGAMQPPEMQTRIFEKRDGRWQQVAAIGTPITQ